MKTVLSCKNVCKRITCGDVKQTILKNISLNITEGEFVSIMGASGAGKSSLLYILGLMDQASSGEICINSINVQQSKENELSNIRRDILGFVFQTYNLVPSLNALDNILLPAYIKSNKKIKEDKRNTALELLDIIGLKDKAEQMISDLSGGEQQRIAVARALINNPQIILMDEPTGNLDSKNGKIIMELVKKINETQNITFLQVTHSEEYAKYGNRILHMRDGEIYKETVVE